MVATEEKGAVEQMNLLIIRGIEAQTEFRATSESWAEARLDSSLGLAASSASSIDVRQLVSESSEDSLQNSSKLHTRERFLY